MTQIWETWLMDSLYIVCDLGQLFPKKKEEKRTFPTQSDSRITLIPKLDKDITRKENCRPVFLMKGDMGVFVLCCAGLRHSVVSDSLRPH